LQLTEIFEDPEGLPEQVLELVAEEVLSLIIDIILILAADYLLICVQELCYTIRRLGAGVVNTFGEYYRLGIGIDAYASSRIGEQLIYALNIIVLQLLIRWEL
jgi:hypothetical protein